MPVPLQTVETVGEDVEVAKQRAQDVPRASARIDAAGESIPETVQAAGTFGAGGLVGWLIGRV